MIREVSQSHYDLYCCKSGRRRRPGRSGHKPCPFLKDVLDRYKKGKGYALKIVCDSPTSTCIFEKDE